MPARPPAPEQVETFARLATTRPDDITINAVASAFGISAGTATRWLHSVDTVIVPTPVAERRRRPSEALHADFYAAEMRRAQQERRNVD